MDRSDRVLPVFGRGLIDALRVRLPGILPDLIRAVEALDGLKLEGDEATGAHRALGAQRALTADRRHGGNEGAVVVERIRSEEKGEAAAAAGGHSPHALSRLET